MLDSRTLRLVLVISCAHALVHVFEQSVPSVEQIVGEEYGVGTDRTGWLGAAFRLPFGLLALAAGLAADRFGALRMLVLYLCGCAACGLAMGFMPSLFAVSANMFVMGCFASIYHPAGLAMLSRETTLENRGKALGIHGVLGSMGIAGAPFLAGLAFQTGSVSWRQYYLILAVPALLLAIGLPLILKGVGSREVSAPAHRETGERGIDWRPYLFLIASGGLSGLVYGGFLQFLPRYLDTAGVLPGELSPESSRNYLAALVLTCGAVGQFTAGRLARPGRLEKMLASILFLCGPLLLWMAVAGGAARVPATCCFALVHFMTQPVYNSLLPEFVAVHRRSMGFGLSNMFSFGCSAAGSALAGQISDERYRYAVLGGLSIAAACLALPLILHRRRMESAAD